MHVATAQAADLEHRSTDFGRLAVGGDLDVVTDDQLDESHVIELGDGHRRHQLPVAQHRDTIGELEHLVEVVRDVDDRHAPLLQAVDDLEQSMDVVAWQRGRRLVEHEQVGSLLPTDESAGDRHGRALRRRQIVDRCLDVDVLETQHLERFARGADLVAPADVTAEPGLIAGGEGDVLDGVERADEPEVLVHEADPRGAGGGAVAERQRLTARPGAGTLVGLVVARQHLDQRRLAGPVLADEGVHLAGLHGDRDVGQSDLSGERLREMFDSQDLGQRLPPKSSPSQ